MSTLNIIPDIVSADTLRRVLNRAKVGKADANGPHLRELVQNMNNHKPAAIRTAKKDRLVEMIIEDCTRFDNNKMHKYDALKLVAWLEKRKDPIAASIATSAARAVRSLCDGESPEPEPVPAPGETPGSEAPPSEPDPAVPFKDEKGGLYCERPNCPNGYGPGATRRFQPVATRGTDGVIRDGARARRDACGAVLMCADCAAEYERLRGVVYVETPEPESTTKKPSAKAAPGSLEAAIEDIVLRNLPEVPDEAAVRGWVHSVMVEARGELLDEDAIEAIVRKIDRPTTIRIENEDRTYEVEGLAHKMFPRLLKNLDRGYPVYLHGPSGWGKSWGAEAAAEHLPVDRVVYVNCNGDMGEHQFMGYNDAHGNYVPSEFRRGWEAGRCIIIVDEADRAPGDVLVALNAATSNSRTIAFPDKTVKAGANVYLVLTGNTLMQGADQTYSSGQAQDGAITNRLKILHWGEDVALEKHLIDERLGEDPMTAKKVYQFCKGLRDAVGSLGMAYAFGPRQSMFIAEALAQGDTWSEATNEAVWGWVEPEDLGRIRSHEAMREVL